MTEGEGSWGFAYLCKIWFKIALKPSDKAALQEKDTVLKLQSSHFVHCHLSLVLLQLKIAECTIGIHPVVVRAGGKPETTYMYLWES